MNRTQIYLERTQHQGLEQRARAAGVTKSEIIREAIDAYLGDSDDAARLSRFRNALAAAGGAVPRLPDGREYVRALREHDAGRATRLAARSRR